MLNLLPPEGSLLTMKIVHELRQVLAFSDEELVALDFQQHEDGRLTWKNTVEPRVIKPGVKATGIVYEALEKLDKEGKLRENHLSLCEKFEYGE